MSSFNRIPGDISAKMANMSFICACMIVLFHATPAPQIGSYMWWICHLLGREGICMIAVPWFFLASGFFLAGHMGESGGWWKREVAKRLCSLVIPFYVWMVVSILFGVAVWYLKVQVLHLQSRECPLSIPMSTFVFKILGLHPFADIGVLWYVRCLFCLVLISPALYWLTRWKSAVLGVLSVSFFGVSWCFTNGFGEDFYFFFDRFVSIRGLLYFFAGMVVRTNVSRMRIGQMAGVIAFVVGIALLVIDNYILVSGNVRWMGIFEAILVPFLLVGVFGFVPKRRFAEWMIGSSFPIFLMHNIFLSTASLMFSALGMYGKAQYDLIMMISRAALSIASSIVCSVLIHKNFPRVSGFIFGGR